MSSYAQFLSLPSGAPSTITKADNDCATIIQTSDAPVTVTLPESVPTISSTTTTLPSSPCPAANGSIYTATNKPLPTLHPQVQWASTETSLFFEILCHTTFLAGGNPSIMDLQIITNVTSLSDCLDVCALYNFQMSIGNFPAYACTGIGWGRGNGNNPVGDPWPVCWLKSNVSLESPNGTDENVFGYDGAVLLLS